MLQWGGVTAHLPRLFRTDLAQAHPPCPRGLRLRVVDELIHLTTVNITARHGSARGEKKKEEKYQRRLESQERSFENSIHQMDLTRPLAHSAISPNRRFVCQTVGGRFRGPRLGSYLGSYCRYIDRAVCRAAAKQRETVRHADDASIERESKVIVNTDLGPSLRHCGLQTERIHRYGRDPSFFFLKGPGYLLFVGPGSE